MVTPPVPERRRHDARVVITGMGALCARGYGVEVMWDFACNPQDEPIDQTVPPARPPDWMDARQGEALDAHQVYGVEVAEHAWNQAGLAAADPARIGIVGAAVYGGLHTVIEQNDLLRATGVPAVSGQLAISASKAGITAVISSRLGIRGHGKTITGGCATGLYALLDGLDLIRSGRVDAVVVAAAQSAIVDVLRASYRNLRTITPDGWVRPFDARRNGFFPTPGAAAMVLESERHATERGARILAELKGAGNTTDGTAALSASGPAPSACIEEALDDAGCGREAIGLVSAHATGTRANDRFEAAILRSTFGTAIPPVTAPKRVLGHTFGAAGLQAAVLAVDGMHRRYIPPVGINVERDPECDVPIVVGEPRAWDPAPVLVLAYGLGGNNGAAVLAPWNEDGQNVE